MDTKKCMMDIKGDLLCKNHFYKVFEQLCGCSVWKQPAYNGKNPPTHLFII